MTTTWQTEFGPDYDVPAIILEAGLKDQSWRNDACPAFAYPLSDDGEKDIVLWADHPDAAQREVSETASRFTVTNAPGDETYYDGDDAEAALAALRAQVAKS
jgi:hypothetical protein